MRELPTFTVHPATDSDLDRLILDAVAAVGNGPNGFNSSVYRVCHRIQTTLPDDGTLIPGGRIHERIVALIDAGRLSYAHGRLTIRETVEQHRCRTRTYAEVIAIAGAEHRRGLL